MGHVREYSLSELNSFFKKLNFRIINKGYCGTYTNNNFLQKTIKILQNLFPSLKNNIYFVLKKIDN